MNSVENNNLQLIRNDFKALKIHLFKENKINDWDKIIIIYNLIIFFNNLYICYRLIDKITNDNSKNFKDQFLNIYILFFIICSIKSSYGYFLYNVSKVDPDLALSFFKNSHQYFI